MLQQNNTTVQDLWNVIKVIPLSKENKEWLANKLRDNDSQTSGKEEDSFSQKVNRVFNSWKDDKRSTAQIKKEIRACRQQNITRHLKFMK